MSGYVRQSSRALHTGSKAWRQQRLRVLVRDLYTCKVCGREGDQVDHIDGDATKDVADDALQTLCREHHSQKTAHELAGTKPSGCDVHGTPLAGWQA